MASESSPDWLPAGWITKSKKSSDSGRKLKYYIDPASGGKFYTKPQVLRYLETTKCDTSLAMVVSTVDDIPVDSQTRVEFQTPVSRTPIETTIESPEWLPHGWITKLRSQNSGRKYKIFVESASGRTFYSKPEVSRYLEERSQGADPQINTTAIPVESQSPVESQIVEFQTQISQSPVETIESPEWLPHGWIMEWKIQNTGAKAGKKYKVYIDPASGCKFFSKPQVSRYLEKMKSSTSPQIGTGSAVDHSLDHSPVDRPALEPDVSQNCKVNTSNISEEKFQGGTDLRSVGHPPVDQPALESDISQNCIMNTSNNAEEKIFDGGNGGKDLGMVERVTDDKFPPGWIKETRIRKTGDNDHKDQFYTDTASGYMFRSKPDALRYLKTGDIRFCKSRPKKRDTNGLDLMNGDISHNMDHLTKEKTFSKPDVPQILASKICETDQSNIKSPREGEHSMNDVVAGKDAVDGLPPGWMKGYITRNVGDGTVKKLFFKDPVSGYIFSSKPDVLRYLKTGNIDSCKFKPKKSDSDDLELKFDDAITHKMDHSTEEKTSSKPDVSQNLASEICDTNQSNIMSPREGEHSMNDAVTGKDAVDGLPPGWMKGYRTRNVGNGAVKKPYYKDPISGYIFSSKPDVLRYLETGNINSCKIKPKKSDSDDLELKFDDAITLNMDHSTEEKAFSKPDVPQNMASEICEKNHSNIKSPCEGEHSMNDIVVGKNAVDGLPPGWTKAYRARNVGNGTVKDPYYKDPVSGYIFRSKPDVLRYLETGNISSCKLKPKKSYIDDLELKFDDAITPSYAAGGKSTIRKQVSGEKRDNTSLSKTGVSPDVGSSRRRRRKNVSDAVMDVPSISLEILEANQAKHVSEPPSKDSKSEQIVNVSAANDIIFSVVNDILQEEKVSDTEQDRVEIQSSTKSSKNRGGIQSSTKSSKKREETKSSSKLRQKQGETQSSTKSNKKRSLDLPLRSSKRLAGFNQEMPPDISLNKPSLQAAIIGPGEIEADQLCPGEIEADQLSDMTHKVSSDNLPEQLQPQAEGEVAIDASIQKEPVLPNELPNGGGKDQQSVQENQLVEQEAVPHSIYQPEKGSAHYSSSSIDINMDAEEMRDIDTEETREMGNGQQEAVPEDKPGVQEAEKQSDATPESKQSPIEYQFLHPWSDPCIEFAFKTLTGAISVEENLSFNDYFQQEGSETQNNGSLEQSNIVLPSSYHTETTQKSVPEQQIAANLTHPPPGYDSLPSFTNTSTTEKSVHVQHIPANTTYPPPGYVDLPSFTNTSTSIKSVAVQHMPADPTHPPPGYVGLPSFTNTSSTEKSVHVQHMPAIPTYPPPGYAGLQSFTNTIATEKSVPVQHMPANPTHPPPGYVGLPSFTNTTAAENSVPVQHMATDPAHPPPGYIGLPRFTDTSATEKSVPVQHFFANSTYPPPGYVGLPVYTSTSSKQSSWEAGNK